MPDFVRPGTGPAPLDGLPVITPDYLANKDSRLSATTLGWLIEAVQEGDRLNRNDPSFDRMTLAQQYVEGEQRQDIQSDKLKYLPRLVINVSRKTLQAHVSAMTDLRSSFALTSTNPLFQAQADLLNKAIVSWWIATLADVALGDALKIGLTTGTADMGVEWDPGLGPWGDTTLQPRDCRDTLPLRPSTQRSIQLWQGLTLRDEHTVNALRAWRPTQAGLFMPSSETLLGQVYSRFRSLVSRIVSPTDTLSGLSPSTAGSAQKPRSGMCVLYRTYLSDATRNLTPKSIVMGDPTTNWSYLVPQGGLLYPRKRLITWTERGIVSDGPNPYWHGLYPVNRLILWDLPWLFLGRGLFYDTMPLQDAINDLARDLQLGIKQWTNQAVKYNRNEVSESFMRLYDPRKPGASVKLAQGLNDGFAKLDGPPAPVLALALQLYLQFRKDHDDLSGVANLQALLQLRQMPSGDTIQKYYEALTPEIRSEARAVEKFLLPVGEMVKTNIFQYYSTTRMLQQLGDQGQILGDFQFDPDDLVPKMKMFTVTPHPETGVPQPTQDPQYVPQLDESLPTHQRAEFFHCLFVLTIAPHSLLAIEAQERKMIDFQLARMGYLDFWSLHEALGTPNVGQPPAIPLPPLQPPDPQEVLQGMGTKYTLDPQSGQVMEIRVPTTVTDRLQAQAMLGLGQTENPAGRKASGQAPPKQEEKKDNTGAPRQTMTESKK